jgi:hypothetical protein
MHANELLTHYPRGESNFNQANLSELKVTPSQPDGVNLFNVVLLQPPIYFALGWVLLSMMLSAMLMVVRFEAVSKEPSHKLRCRNCRFFSSNPFLKCAVQPYIALTEKALDCSDYSPQEHKYFQKLTNK